MAPPQPKKPKKKNKDKEKEAGPRKDSAEYVTGGEFGRHFQEQYGERWLSLREALCKPGRHVAWDNLFVRDTGLDQLGLQRAHDVLPVFFSTEVVENGSAMPAPERIGTPLTSHYLLDLASLLPPLALGARPGDKVLDMCSAPGGKALVLASLMFATHSDDAEYGLLVCNELSGPRRARLRRVLEEYLPEKVRECVRVTAHDGTKWGRHEPEYYDRVLVDAPCGSERHHCQQMFKRREMIGREEWSATRARRNHALQVQLLSAAVQALRDGGRVVYSTCSIADIENDHVVQKVIERGRGSVVCISHTVHLGPLMQGAERTALGHIMLPDATEPFGGGWGPLYWAVLEKRGVVNDDGSDGDASE